jgi:hypothetical protein
MPSLTGNKDCRFRPARSPRHRIQSAATGLKWDSLPPSRFPRCYYAAKAAAFSVEGS